MRKGKAKRSVKGPGRATSSTATAAMAILSVFVLLLGGIGVAMDRAEYFIKPPEEKMTYKQVAAIATRNVQADLFFLAVQAVEYVDNASLVPANVKFEELVNDLSRSQYDPMKIGDYRITFQHEDFRISFMPMTVTASVCSGNLSVSGENSPFAIPAYYRLEGTIIIDIRDGKHVNGGERVSIDQIIPDISPYIETRLTELDANGQSEFSDIGRLVRYMLTTLVRYRAFLGIGSGPYDTEKDLLNEGDVELAVNIAVLLEEARLFGTYDREAVDAVDHYFYQATDPEEHMGELAWEPYNPTGMRPWGSAEKKNYARYQNKLVQGEERTLGSLFENYVKEGVVDPADVFALYLNIDQYERGTDIDPLDGTSFLYEHLLFDGRYTSDRRDPDHLVYMANIGPRELVLRDPTGDFGLDYHERLAVDQSPDYLTIGSDLAVTKNITVPYKWMTNTRLSEGSRTGGVPPPQPPPDHDWVMLWEFRISGAFTLSVGRDSVISQEDSSSRKWLVTRDIAIDIPITIFTPLKIRPMNSAMTFTNLNTGSPPGATYNFTYESIAYEHFSNSTWSAMKDLYSAALGEAIRIVKGDTCPYPTALSRGSDIAFLASDIFQGVPADTWSSVDQFVTERLITPDVSTQILRPLLNSQYFVRIEYKKGGPGAGPIYTLRFIISSNVGPITIDMAVTEGGLFPKGRATLDMDVMVDGAPYGDTGAKRGHWVSYGLVWNDVGQRVVPTGSGHMHGDWAVVASNQGLATMKGVQSSLGDGLTVRVFQVREDHYPDAIYQIHGAMPVSLNPDPAIALASIAQSLGHVEVSSLMMLLTTDVEGDTWYGFRTTTKQGLSPMMDWIALHSEELVELARSDRLEGSTIGTLAAKEITSSNDIGVSIMAQDTVFFTPVSYYSNASQMFQDDVSYGPVRMDRLGISMVTTASSSNPVVKSVIIDYNMEYQVSLTDPEVRYGAHGYD